MSEIGTLGVVDILRMLPQRVPFVMIDRILELVVGQRIVASKALTTSERCFEGHFDGYPVLPGTAAIECMVQASCLLVQASDPFDPTSTIAALMGLSKVRFHRLVGPGDALEIEAQVISRRSNVWRFEGKVYCRDLPVVEGALALSFRNRSDTI